MIRLHHAGRKGSPSRSRAAWRAARAVLLLASLCVAASSAGAEYLLADAKKAGQVGEKRDGFLALIDQRAPDEIKKMVESTNERRRDRYRKVAEKLGWTEAEAGAAAAKRTFRHAEKGDLLETESGGWKRKTKAPPKPRLNAGHPRKGRIPAR